MVLMGPDTNRVNFCPLPAITALKQTMEFPWDERQKAWRI